MNETAMNLFALITLAMLAYVGFVFYKVKKQKGKTF